jgi:hypothetical protein
MKLILIKVNQHWLNLPVTMIININANINVNNLLTSCNVVAVKAFKSYSKKIQCQDTHTLHRYVIYFAMFAVAKIYAW